MAFMIIRRELTGQASSTARSDWASPCYPGPAGIKSSPFQFSIGILRTARVESPPCPESVLCDESFVRFHSAWYRKHRFDFSEHSTIWAAGLTD